jgi:hypothetical protein
MKIESRIITIPVNIDVETARVALKISCPNLYNKVKNMSDQEIIENLVKNCVCSFGISLPEGALKDVN